MVLTKTSDPMFVSVLIYSLFFIWTVLYTVLCLPFFAVAMLLTAGQARIEKRRAVFRFFIYYYGKVILRTVFFPWIRIHVEHASNPPGEIYVFNHRSASDPFLAAAVLDRPLAQIVNAWPMRLPFLGFFARHGDYVDILNMDYDSIRDRIRKLVSAGVPIIAFPEGTRSGSREMNQFHSGIFRIAKELGYSITPVVITGNERIPDRSFRIRSGTICIRELPVIPADAVRRTSPFVMRQKVRDIMLAESRLMDLAADGGCL